MFILLVDHKVGTSDWKLILMIDLIKILKDFSKERLKIGYPVCLAHKEVSGF